MSKNPFGFISATDLGTPIQPFLESRQPSHAALLTEFLKSFDVLNVGDLADVDYQQLLAKVVTCSTLLLLTAYRQQASKRRRLRMSRSSMRQ